jgi:hypothetical protein
MKTSLILSLAALTAATLVPLTSAQAGHRGGCCCGSVTYAAPAAASPAAAVTPAPAATVAQNQGYRSFSYQPATTAAPTYYRGNYSRRSNQPTWMIGGAKSLGIYK